MQASQLGSCEPNIKWCNGSLDYSSHMLLNWNILTEFHMHSLYKRRHSDAIHATVQLRYFLCEEQKSLFLGERIHSPTWWTHTCLSNCSWVVWGCWEWGRDGGGGVGGVHPLWKHFGHPWDERGLSNPSWRRCGFPLWDHVWMRAGCRGPKPGDSGRGAASGARLSVRAGAAAETLQTASTGSRRPLSTA